MELAPSAIQSIGLEDIDVFRRKIYSDCDDGNRPRGDMLGHLEKPSQMCIYENSDVYYSSTRQPLDEDLPIASYGDSIENVLIVEVPLRRNIPRKGCYNDTA
ncbi:hypothetical protein F441_10163 [Phytophthora nicotianae CJ01A1]|uniref:Uncharacterized protein n=2 Tax=Phytophthora nicotianae TaxID=4792 RepID=W2WZ85_PHYNI|nr:hypothetical protein L915_10005 [Phytophthora nicotianae]ETP14914.1 hypothetical protein F441_10163 [Phytophthora nicotianae CJ01A1]